MEKKHLVLYIIFLFGVLLWIGPSNFLLREISHDIPTGYYASDALQNAALAEYTHETGFYHKYPHYLNYGRDETVNPYYPSLSYLSTIFSNFSGLEAYDSNIFLAYFFVVIAALLFLFIFDNPNLAVLCSPLLLFLFLNRFQLGFLFGTWQYSTSASLAIAILWLLRKDIKLKYVLIGLLTASMFLSHLTDTIPLYIIIFIFLLFDKFKSLSIKHLIFAILIALFISSIYLSYLLPHSKIHGQSDMPIIEFKIVQPESYSVNLNDFGILVEIVLLIGILVSIFYFKNYFYPFLIGIVMLFFDYVHYINGMPHLMFQARNMLLPIFICFFLGLLILITINTLKFRFKHFSFIISATIILLIFISFYSPSNSPGIVDPKHWQMFKWLEKNTDKEATLLYAYHESQDQTNIFYFAKRKTFRLRIDNYIDSYNEKKIYRYCKISYHPFIMDEKISPFVFKEISAELYPPVQDICNFEYIIIDLESLGPNGQYINYYNSLLNSKLLNNTWIKAESTMNSIYILKNNEPGRDCMEKEGFDYGSK